MKSIKLKEWEQSTQELAEYFNIRYFGKLDHDAYWIASEIGGTYAIADYYFGLAQIVDYIKYSYTVDEMFDHYNYALEKATEDKSYYSIRNWRKLQK